MKFNYTLGWDRSVRGGPVELVNKGSNANSAGQWFNRTNVVSDTAGVSATVSTQLVNSDSLIFFTMQVANYAVGSLTFAQNFVVSTISPGGFFKVQNASSIAAVGSGWLLWEIKNPL
jgi:hypothetical protein